MDSTAHNRKRTLLSLLLTVALAVTMLAGQVSFSYGDEAEGVEALQEETLPVEEGRPEDTGDSIPAEEAPLAEPETQTQEEEEPLLEESASYLTVEETPAMKLQEATPATAPAAAKVAETAMEVKSEKNGIHKEGGKYYYYKNGHIQKGGWIHTGGKWYCASADGSFYVSRFISVDGRKYYVDATGATKTGRFKVGQHCYYGATSGVPLGQIRTGWFSEGGKRYVATNSGKLYKKGWIKKNGGKYYVTADGSLASGTFKVGKNYYHAKLSGSRKGRICTGWFKDSGVRYAAKKSGALYRSRWLVKSGKYYRVSGKGVLATDCVKAVGGIPYRFNSKGAMVRETGWGKYQGKYYYKKANGFPLKNALKNRKGKTYYLGKKGLSIGGWKLIAGNYCYFSPKTGALLSNKVAPALTKFKYKGTPLSAGAGVVYGPSGKETYYNLPMGGVISIMRGYGYNSKKYPYWVRKDGCKMLGPYIMVAAHWGVHPLGSIVPTSRGLGLVCDTGTFIYSNARQLDLAVSW